MRSRGSLLTTTKTIPPLRGISELRNGVPSMVPLTRIRALNPAFTAAGFGTRTKVQAPATSGRISLEENEARILLSQYQRRLRNISPRPGEPTVVTKRL